MTALLDGLTQAGEDRNGWLPLAEAVKYTPLSYQGFYKRVVMKHEIPAIRPGNTGFWFVHRDELAKWLNAGTCEANSAVA